MRRYIGAGPIDIRYYKMPNETSPVVVEKLRCIKCNDMTANLETLPNTSWSLQTTQLGWSGFMQSYKNGQYPGQSSICFLPKIDVNLSDITFTLHFCLFVKKVHVLE